MKFEPRNAILALLAMTASLYAQVTTATIYGRVLDPSDAGVPQAKITIVNEQTNSTSNTTSDEKGEFTVAFLPVGPYRISIEAPGFKGQKRSNIELSAGQRAGLDFRLEVGNVTEVVEITAAAAQINTVSAEQREGKIEAQVRELPLSRRDWTNIIGLGTGITSQGNGVSMNGLPGSGFRLTVDGTDAEADPEAPSLGMSGNFNPIKTVSMEAISELAVTKGIPSAEVANTMSGGINIITKNGTNAFHGSLFLNNQVEDFAARPQFAATKGALTYNQFGGSIGGPIVRNKLFFFGVYEGYRQSRAQTISGNVPTAEFRAQAIAAVPAYKPFFDLFPLPTGAVTPGATNAFFVTNASNPGRDNHAVTRIDYHIKDNLIMSARYTRGRPFVQTPRVATLNPQTYNGVTESGTLNFIYSRPTWTNETRFGVNHNEVAREDGIYTLGIAGISSSNIGFGTGGETLGRSGETISWENVSGKTFGRHNVKVGMIYLTRAVRRVNIESPSLTYSNNADFLANLPSSVQVTFGVLPFEMTQWQLGGFIQDDFRVSRRLTLNIGTRYDYFSVPRERDNRLFNISNNGFGTLLPPDHIYNADRNNFSPRLGFAYSLDDDSKTVIRGGLGIFVNPRNMFGGPVDLVQNAIDEPFRRVFSRADVLQYDVLRFPVVNANVLPLVKGAPLSPASVISENYVNPYSIQMQLGIQRQLTSTLVIETGYIGTRGLKLNMVRDLNQPDRITGVRPNAALSTYRAYDGSDRSRYESWQTSLRKRMTNGFLYNMHYTWSKQLTFSDGDLLLNNTRPQDNNNLRAEWGPGPTDVAHRFAADFLYELPFSRWGSNSAFQRLTLGGWQLSGVYTAQTGTAFSIANPSSISGQRLDYIGGDAYAATPETNLFYLNRAAFAEVPQITASGAPIRPGNLGRNALRMPGFWNFDLGLAKNFKFTEQTRFQIRADLLNSLNHTNFSSVDTNIRSANFGKFTGTRGARVVQFNARLTF